MKNRQPSQRQLRVGEEVRHVLAQFLQRGVLRDAVLEREVLSLSEVRMSPDLKIATCFIAPLGGGETQEVIKRLNAHARFIRGQLARELRQMKYMPQFRFHLDETYDNYARIDALLRLPAVQRDLHSNEPEQDV